MKVALSLTFLFLSVLAFDNGCQNIPKGTNLNSYQYEKGTGPYLTYMEWYTFYLYDYTAGVYFFVNNIKVIIAGFPIPLILGWPAYLTPQGHTGMELKPYSSTSYKIDPPTGNNSITTENFVSRMSYGDNIAFTNGKFHDFSWDLTYEKVQSIPLVCNAYKAKIDLLSPEFSWIPTSPLNRVTGKITHNSVVYDIDSNGQMEHVFGKLFEPALSWWYAISGVSKDEVLIIIAYGLPGSDLTNAVASVSVWIKGVQYLWVGSQFTVNMHTLSKFIAPKKYDVSGTNANGDTLTVNVVVEDSSFVGNGQTAPEEKKANFKFTVCPKGQSCQSFNQYGWNEYSHFILNLHIKSHIEENGGNYNAFLKKSNQHRVRHLNSRSNKKDEL